MVDHVEVIKKQMDDARHSLADKIEALEDQVSDTVKEATTDVTDTVKTVKETVEEVTGTVKEAVSDVTHTVADTVEEVGHNVADFFDITGHIRRHPWAGLGGSVFLGVLIGQLLPRSQPKAEPVATVPFTSEPPRMPAEPRGAAKPEQKGWFVEQLERLKGLAIGSVLGVVRDVAVHSLPEPIGKRISEEVNRLTGNLGGETIEEPILATAPEPSQKAKPPEPNGRKSMFTARG